MKKIFCLFIFLLTVIHGNSQSNYTKYSNYKIIRKEQTDSVLIQNVDGSRQIILQKDLEYVQKGKINSKRVFKQIETINKKNYFSNKYALNGEDIYILPTIGFKTDNDALLNKIKDIFNGNAVINKNYGIYFINYPFISSDEVLEKVSLISNINGIEWCEPDMYIKFESNNVLYPSQYYLKNTGQNGGTIGVDINVEPAWNITQGDPNIIVAIIDDGVDKGHEDLLDRVLDGYTVGDSLGKGSPKNPTSYNPKAHGMACAGIIAATDNNIGIKGIANKVKILPINVVQNYDDAKTSGYASAREYADAINWASYRSDIMNCSWSARISNEFVYSAINDALNNGREGRGCVVVASSGNNYKNGENMVGFPANMNNVISVGAIDSTGSIQEYSQRGNDMDLVAPSGFTNKRGNVATLDRMGALGENPNGNYVSTFGGTSAACPQVVGVAALMLSVNPDLTAQQVRNILQQTARDLGPTGFDTTYGYGLVNAEAAVKAARSYDIYGPSFVCDNATFSINGLPSGFTVNWRFTNNALIIASGQGTTTLNVSKNSDAKITLYADIKHNGSTVTTLSKEVFVGTPMLGMMINPIGADGIEGRWCEGMAGNKFTIEGKSAVDAYDYLQVKIYKLANNGTKTLAYTNNNFLYGSSIPYTFSNGFYELQVRGVKDCGTSQWLIGQVSATSGSGGGMFPLDMQISYDPSAETLNVTIMEDEGGDELQGIQASINNNTKTVSDEVYDVQLWSETAMVRHFTTTDSCFTISMNGLKRGTYILRVSKNGKIVTKKVIK